MVRCKFKIASIVEEQFGSRITAEAVIDDSPENKAFFEATPSGLLTLNTVNPKVLEQFKEGDEIFLDISVVTY